MSSINLNFVREMVEFAEAGKMALQDMTKMVLMDIAFSLVNKSPVADPKSWKNQPTYLPISFRPGTFKNNWKLSVDTPSIDRFFVADPTGIYSIERIRMAIPRWAIGHQYYFSNSLPYSQALENGWSRQAPFGMVALTAQRFPQIVEDVQRRYALGERPVNKAIPK